ncbi:hypothetical protein CLV36_10474 [Laceyella sediminis]|uniref:Uncharacterized protein n=2 Tax=Laceyella TaxID=292635 RepID=A0AA46AF23_9BACL|nr:hypothetical protein CLV36_10474 [Laceyella sediminis]SMP17980.1 hypothetical protein SAMN06265361_10398 [Laceyella tengchongensis]
MFKIIYFTGLIIMFIFRLFYRWRSNCRLSAAILDGMGWSYGPRCSLLAILVLSR